ncbi:hypothetical protein Tco_0963143 [Tanacetum coccineum]
MKIKESLNVTFNEIPPPLNTSPLEDNNLVKKEAIEVSKNKPLGNDVENETLEIDKIVNIKESKSHPLENIIGNLNQRTLRPQSQKRNKLDENGIVSRNKARLVAQGYNQPEGIDYDKTYAPDPKTSHLEAVKRILQYIKGTTNLGLWYLKGSGIETEVYAEFDHVGDYVDRKSTSSICMYMGYCFTSWFSKKQTALAISTTEAEYVSAKKVCQQAVWMKQDLIDYDILLDDIPIM